MPPCSCTACWPTNRRACPTRTLAADTSCRRCSGPDRCSAPQPDSASNAPARYAAPCPPCGAAAPGIYRWARRTACGFRAIRAWRRTAFHRANGFGAHAATPASAPPRCGFRRPVDSPSSAWPAPHIVQHDIAGALAIDRRRRRRCARRPHCAAPRIRPCAALVCDRCCGRSRSACRPGRVRSRRLAAVEDVAVVASRAPVSMPSSRSGCGFVVRERDDSSPAASAAACFPAARPPIVDKRAGRQHGGGQVGLDHQASPSSFMTTSMSMALPSKPPCSSGTCSASMPSSASACQTLRRSCLHARLRGSSRRLEGVILGHPAAHGIRQICCSSVKLKSMQFLQSQDHLGDDVSSESRSSRRRSRSCGN